MKYRLIVVAIAFAFVGQARAVPVVVTAHPVVVAHPVAVAHSTVAPRAATPVARTVATALPAPYAPRVVPVVVAPVRTASPPGKKCEKGAKDCK